MGQFRSRASRRRLAILLSLCASAGCYIGGTSDGIGGGLSGGQAETEGGDAEPLDERDPGRVTLRRLNRVEYANTLRDLFFGLDLGMTDAFPADEQGLGYDNIADVLSVTPLLLELQEGVARATVEAALRDPHRARFEAEDFGPDSATANSTPYDGGYKLLNAGQISAPLSIEAPGRYRLTARAFGEFAGPDLPKMGFLINGVEVGVVEVEADVNAPGEYSIEADLLPGENEFAVSFLNDFYAAPADRNLGVDWIAVEGPLAGGELIDVRSQLMTCAPAPDDALPCIEETLQRFAERAWRRPLRDAELDALVAIAEQNLADGASDGGSWRDALAVAMTRVLVSPHFMFRVELDPDPTSTQPHLLDDFELASRLSYFLWSTMPDDELFALAREGRLQDEDVLEQQVKRMLADVRAEALVHNFMGQWLYLRHLGHELAKDPAVFPEFDAELLASMRTEMEMFISTFAYGGRDMRELLTSKTTFVDDALARLYGLSAPGVGGFAEVDLGDLPRQGLLTQAGLMSVLSHSSKTSPVQRGHWVLSQLLCMAPPSPPPDLEIPPLEAVNGNTMREILEQHRALPQCQACHEFMDPIGLGFEHYDALGRWRPNDNGFEIDATGKLPGGVSFDGPIDIANGIAASEAFATCTTRHVLTYALGRALVGSDNDFIDEIAQAFIAGDYDFETVLVKVVTSHLFRARRGEP